MTIGTRGGRGVAIGVCGVHSGTGGHEIESGCWVGAHSSAWSRSLLTQSAHIRSEAEGDFEVEDGVVVVADWFTVGVVAAYLVDSWSIVFSPAFTQAQPLHEPVLLHRYHGAWSKIRENRENYAPRKFCAVR